MSQVSWPRTQHNIYRPGLELGPLNSETSALTMRTNREATTLPQKMEKRNFDGKIESTL